ncbi:MAG: hypothetical protein V3R84_05755 [Acidimicrobiia bacterium]
MNIIQDQLASLWLLTPIGALVIVGLAALLVTGVPARIVHVIGNAGWRRQAARQRRVERRGAAAVENAESARMAT